MELRNQDIKESKKNEKTNKIILKNIKKYYNKKRALDIEKLEFIHGEVTYLVGENGAGKSTLLNIIARIDEEYSGDILGSYRQDEISLVDANPYMLKGSVYNNIKYPLEIRAKKNKNKTNVNIQDIDKKIEELIKIFNVDLLRNKEASRLSSGETQKVAILRALSFEPKLLLLDEPTANLDKETKAELIELIKKYKEMGKTIIIVTHDYDFFKNLEGRRVELEKIR